MSQLFQYYYIDTDNDKIITQKEVDIQIQNYIDMRYTQDKTELTYDDIAPNMDNCILIGRFSSLELAREELEMSF